MEGEVRDRNILLKMVTTTLRKEMVLMLISITILKKGVDFCQYLRHYS